MPTTKRPLSETPSRSGDGDFFESDRQRLAREIHDTLIQELTGAVLQMEICEKTYRTNRDQVLGPLTKAKEQTRKCLKQLRQLTFELRLTNVRQLGLADALRRHGDDVSKESGIAIDFQVMGSRAELPLSVGTSLFCIAREALLNTTKHAEAKRISINLSVDPTQAILAVKDDGRGFEVESSLAKAGEQKKFGLMGMQERARLLGGTLRIKSRPGGGTEVVAAIPDPLSRKAQSHD